MSAIRKFHGVVPGDSIQGSETLPISPSHSQPHSQYQPELQSQPILESQPELQSQPILESQPELQSQPIIESQPQLQEHSEPELNGGSKQVEDCSICMEPMLPDQNIWTTASCHHSFHSECLIRWWSVIRLSKTSRQTCLRCRTVARSYNGSFTVDQLSLRPDMSRRVIILIIAIGILGLLSLVKLSYKSSVIIGPFIWRLFITFIIIIQKLILSIVNVFWSSACC